MLFFRCINSVGNSDNILIWPQKYSKFCISECCLVLDKIQLLNSSSQKNPSQAYYQCFNMAKYLSTQCDLLLTFSIALLNRSESQSHAGFQKWYEAKNKLIPILIQHYPYAHHFCSSIPSMFFNYRIEEGNKGNSSSYSNCLTYSMPSQIIEWLVPTYEYMRMPAPLLEMNCKRL